MLVVNDPESEFRRIERRPVRFEDRSGFNRPNGSTSSVHQSNGSADHMGMQRRNKPSGGENVPSREHVKAPGAAKTSREASTFVWQDFPQALRARLDWTLDLVCSFRGPAWNWRIQAIPAITDIENREPADARRVSDFVREQLTHFIALYLVLDLIKVAMMKDQYFWGFVSPTPPPPGYLPSVITRSSVLTKYYRLLLSLSGILVALNVSLAPWSSHRNESTQEILSVLRQKSSFV